MSMAFGPYSPVRQAGNFWFVSGQVGVNPTTKAAAPNVSEQAYQSLANIKNLLAQEHLTMDDIVKTTIFVTNIEDFVAVNNVYEQFFKQPRPARSMTQVAALPKVAGDTVLLVEIEA